MEQHKRKKMLKAVSYLPKLVYVMDPPLIPFPVTTELTVVVATVDMVFCESFLCSEFNASTKPFT